VFMQLTVSEDLRVGRCDSNEVLALFPQLAAHSHRPAGPLSGGRRQLLSLVRALARDPQALLADELSLGKSPQVVDRLLRAVRLEADEGMGVLPSNSTCARPLTSRTGSTYSSAAGSCSTGERLRLAKALMPSAPAISPHSLAPARRREARRTGRRSGEDVLGRQLRGSAIPYGRPHLPSGTWRLQSTASWHRCTIGKMAWACIGGHRTLLDLPPVAGGRGPPQSGQARPVRGGR
jgi:hypothetical protein